MKIQMKNNIQFAHLNVHLLLMNILIIDKEMGKN
jgi:hypothetical protein